MTARIPAEVDAVGRRWRVRRAWPAVGGEGDADLELAARGVPGVRAGRWSATSGASVQPEPIDARLPALASVAAEGVVVSLRAGRRAVVHTADGRSFVKVSRRPGRVREAHERAARFAAGFAIADVIERPGDEPGVVRFTALPGRTLHAIGADPAVTGGEVRRAWETWSEGWLHVLALGPRASGDLPAHTASDEAGVVRTWAAHAAAMQSSPVRAGAVRASADRIAGTLEDGTYGPLVLAHRDLHDKQILWHAGMRPGLLDLDTASRAEAALDLGNLRAHVAFRVAQGALDAPRARAATETVDAVVARVGVDPARVAAYEAATRLRLGCLYLFRPAWRAVAARWLARECGPPSRG